MEILILGERFSQNLGDPLLCENVNYLIKKHYKNATTHFFDISGKISFTDNYPFNSSEYSFNNKLFFKISNYFDFFFQKSPYYRLYKTDESRFIRVMLHLETVLKQHTFDLAVFAGGSLFMDYFVAIIYHIIKRLQKENIPIVFHACGTGYLSEDGVYLLKKGLSSKIIKSVSVRDSFDLIKQYTNSKCFINETFDTALCSPSFFERSQGIAATYGIGIIDKTQYYEFQKELVEFFLKTNYSFKLFTNGSPYDQYMAYKIMTALNIPKNKQDEFILPLATDTKNLVRNVTSFEYIISFRLHSLIVASAYGIPNIGFQWDKKIKEFYEKINKSEFCYKIPEHIGNLNFVKIFDKYNNDLLNITSKQAKESALNLFNQIDLCTS